MGLAPTYAYVVQNSRSEPKGGGGSVYVHYSLSETLDLRLSGLWTGHDIAGTDAGQGTATSGGLFQVVNLALGFRYALDLLDISPAFEVGAGWLHRRFRQGSASDLGLQLGVSVDYWLLRWLSLGAAFHYHAFISNPVEYPVYFDAGPRIGMRLF